MRVQGPFLMALPEFTPDEAYFIGCVKSPSYMGISSAFPLGYMVGSRVLAGFGLYHENLLMIASAFVVLCGFRFYEARLESKSIPVWRSIIEKYESALADTPS